MTTGVDLYRGRLTGRAVLFAAAMLMAAGALAREWAAPGEAAAGSAKSVAPQPRPAPPTRPTGAAAAKLTAAKPAALPTATVPAASPAAPTHLKSASAGPAVPAFRDPFRVLDAPMRAAAPASHSVVRPPGLRGLEVAKLTLQGIVQEEDTHAMIAMVTNGTKLSYFLREHQKLFDGEVTKITRSTLCLRQDAASSGAKTRDIVLRLGPAAAEAQ